MRSSTIHLNVIPLGLDADTLRCSFYTDPDKNLWPLNHNEIPKGLGIDHQETIYTDFKTHPKADITFSVALKESPNFAKHYLNYLLYEWFEGRARLRKKDFVNNNVLYFLKEQDQQQNLTLFDRFTLRGTWGRLTNGAELTVMYSGTMKVWNRSILAYEGPSRDFRWVIYDGHVHRYEDLMEKRRVDRREVYPVINRQVARQLGLRRPQWKPVNRMKRHSRQIDAFYKRWVTDENFQERFRPLNEGFMVVNEDELHRVDDSAANLLFGDGVTAKDPYQGIKEGGPYQPPRTSHIELFIIVAEEDAKKVGNRLYDNLKNGLRHFHGLSDFTKIPVYVSPKNIIFSNSENPLPEVRQQLRTMAFKDGVQYGAIYISPIGKWEQDPQKHRVYYRMKEELLKYNITSQVINRKSVLDSDFAYYLPNIAVALLAKLDGTPWTVQQKEKEELVIGVGAFSPHRYRKTYLGSAFCFSNNGDFRGFESFTADDHLKLAGSFQKAVKQFKAEYDNVERVVIHFYKKMSRKEANVIMNALRELKLDVPLVILTIHKTGSSDLVLADRSKPHRLPVSGTYYRSGHRQFLLCNNTRFDEGEKLRAYPYPIKVYFDLRGQNGEEIERRLEDEAWVRGLMEQVYQFSRLNWQTVSSNSSMPVTILYPEMVARKFPYFDGDIIPEFGKRNFWFL